ncbi:MAG: 2-amino-3,7-dideoxy-D-threo-hept-6-ulosonate synthase [Bacteroidota bacterium]
MNGKEIRMSKILPLKNNRGCIVPIDHGATYGPISGIENSYNTIDKIIIGGATGIVLHKGILARISKYERLKKANYIMHVSASTSLGAHQSEKVLVGSVEEAVKLGATGVSVHVNLGVDAEPKMIRDFGIVSEKCYEWGMPLLAMMYADSSVKNIAHAARLAEEIGADMVKVNYPGNAEDMRHVISCVDIPVLIAGGTRIDKLVDFLRVVDESVFGGASGVSIGRNVFQHEQTRLVTEVICNLLEEKWHIDECVHHVNKNVYQLLN